MSIRTINRVFYARMNQDVMLSFFFEGKDLAQIADRQSAFLLKSAGLPVDIDELQAPSSAHRKIAPILTGHFDRRMTLLKEVLIASGLTPAQANVWVSFEESFRAQVVSGD